MSGYVKAEPGRKDPLAIFKDESSQRHSHSASGDDEIVREIDVYISPHLSSSLHLLQFPIQSAYSSKKSGPRPCPAPASAKIRHQHDMLELEYAIPRSTKDSQALRGALPDTLCLDVQTFASRSVQHATHAALAKLDETGTRLDIVPLRHQPKQMRPSFEHLHAHDAEDEEDEEEAARKEKEAADGPKPILPQKKESEFAERRRRSSHAYKIANEEAEEWCELEVCGYKSRERKDLLRRGVPCADRQKELRLAWHGAGAMDAMELTGDDDNGNGSDAAETEAVAAGYAKKNNNKVARSYVRSLNYLDAVVAARASGGRSALDSLGEWNADQAAADATKAAKAAVAAMNIGGDADAMDTDDRGKLLDGGDTEIASGKDMAIAELAAKLAVLLQAGNGTPVPYRVVRDRFPEENVPDDVLTAALSACAVLVRGNFALKSSLMQFPGGGGVGKGGMRGLRDLILLLLNMHGMIQRERLIKAYQFASAHSGSSRTSIGKKKKKKSGDDVNKTSPETVTFILSIVARPSSDCWVAKVDDDEEFAGRFPKLAARHGMYWMKVKEKFQRLVDRYEETGMVEEVEDENFYNMGDDGGGASF